MIKNREDLIEKANLINDENERLEFVMDYFFKTVEYDYSNLLATGYLKENITSLLSVDNKVFVALEPSAFLLDDLVLLINNKEEKVRNGKSVYIGVEKGLSKMFDAIVELEKNANRNIEKFENNLFNFLKYEFSKRIDNEELVLKETMYLTRKIVNDLTRPISLGKNNSTFVAYRPNVSMVLSCYLAKIKVHSKFRMEKGIEYFPAIIGEDGLLKRGVCADFANYLLDFLPQIGIEAHRIDGTSEFSHAWIAAKVNGVYKSIDLTRAIFIRDGYKGIPKKQTADMWLLCDFEDAFMMQSTRTITGIDLDENGKSIPTPYVINGNNFDSDNFALLISEKEKKNNHSK